MKKILLWLCMMAFPWNAVAKINIVGTLPIFASLAQEVGGDRVEVTSLARGNQDPHFLDAKPTYVVALNKADLLIHGGLDLEVGWLPPVLVRIWIHPRRRRRSAGPRRSLAGHCIVDDG